MNTINLKSWVSCAAFFGALFFSTVVFAGPIKVELKVNDSVTPPKLEIFSNNQKCDTTILDCIEVEMGKKPYIIFDLPNACGSDVGDPQYKLSSMRISLFNKDWPTSSDPLNPKVAEDFNADPNTGKIDFYVGNNKKTNKKLKLKDKNNHAYTVFYEIMAIHCDEDSDADNIFFDPEIRNKGKG